MLQAWTGRAIGKMHNNRITYSEVAAELGVSVAYVSMILNGARSPKDGRERIESAVSAIIARRAERN